MILPPGPEPLPTSDISIPFSLAAILAAGLATTLFPVDVVTIGLDETGSLFTGEGSVEVEVGSDY